MNSHHLRSASSPQKRFRSVLLGGILLLSLIAGSAEGKQESDVTLISDSYHKEAMSGQPAKYTITVRNIGSHEITVLLVTVEDEEGCQGYSSSIEQVSGTIATNSYEQVILTVYISDSLNEQTANQCETTVIATALPAEPVTPSNPTPAEVTVTTTKTTDEFGSVSENNDARQKKLLIVGIDGLRGDVAESIASNNNSFGRVKEEGAWSFNVDVGPYAISGPGWSSMLTGVWCDRHGVVDNTFRGSQLDTVPDLFEFIETHNQDMDTAAVYRWEPIEKFILGEGSADLQSGFDSDEEVQQRAVELLSSEPDLDALFVSLDDVDAAGHSNGFSPEVAEYVEAAETAEKMTNNILAALDGRDQNNESWLIIITSDHGGGGMFLKMHHPSTLIDRNSFMLVSGESTRLGEMTNNPVITDVTATALTHLAIPLPEGEDKLDGRASPFEQNTSTVREASCAQPAFYYRVNLMIALVGSCFLSITAIAIFIIVRLRQQYQGSNVQQIATESDEESIPMSQSL